MNPLSITFALILFILGLYVGRSTHINLPSFPKSSQAESTAKNPEYGPTALSPEILTEPTITPYPTSTQKLTQTIAPTNEIKSTTSLSVFIYPLSTLIEKIENTIKATSSDSPTLITNWYEKTIKDNGYTSTTVAKSSSNGNILNKLGASKNGETVIITIQKNEEDSSTSIQLELQKNSGNNVRINIQNNN